MSGTITGTRAGTTSKRVCCSEHEGRKAGEHETGCLECVWTGTVSLHILIILPCAPAHSPGKVVLSVFRVVHACVRGIAM